MLLDRADRADEARSVAGKPAHHRDDVEGLLGLTQPDDVGGTNVNLAAFVDQANRAMS